MGDAADWALEQMPEIMGDPWYDDGPGPGDEVFTLPGTLVGETERAWQIALFRPPPWALCYWFPKSRCAFDTTTGLLEAPLWLLEAKGLYTAAGTPTPRACEAGALDPRPAPQPKKD